MRTYIFAVLLACALAGCGSHVVDYSPTPLPANDKQQAASFVEQAFYEDAGRNRPSSVLVTDRYILLSNGLLSKTSSFGSAVPLGTGAIAAGDATTVTKEIGQRLYFNSMTSALIRQKNGRANRFVVMLRRQDGSTLRAVNARSLMEAKRFADAFETLRLSSPN
jgi:hypothetical protein